MSKNQQGSFRPLFWVVGLALTCLAAPAEARVLPFEPQVVTLDNGLRLVTVPYDSPGLMAYYSVVRVGSRDEVEAGVTGFAHFFEHMMFRGTEAWPPKRIEAFLQRAGADVNGFTTDDFTCYTFMGSSAHLEDLVAYEADRFKNLKYEESAFKTEAGAVLGEYNKSSSGPYLPLQEKLRSLVFKKHTYGHTTLGYLKDIQDMPNQYAYSLKFFDRFYTPDNLTVVVVGDFDAQKLEALVKTHYGDWKKKRARTRVRPEPTQRKPLRGKVAFANRTLPMLTVSWRTPAARYGSSDTAAQAVLFELLFGEVSDVYRQLVLESQTVVSFNPMGWPHRDPYLFSVMARVKDPANLKATETRIDEAVRGMAAGRIDAQLLEDVKARTRYQLLLGLSTPARIALQYAQTIGVGGEVDGLEKWLQAIETLKPKDMQRFARKYLKSKNRTIVTLVSE